MKPHTYSFLSVIATAVLLGLSADVAPASSQEHTITTFIAVHDTTGIEGKSSGHQNIELRDFKTPGYKEYQKGPYILLNGSRGETVITNLPMMKAEPKDASDISLQLESTAAHSTSNACWDVIGSDYSQIKLSGGFTLITNSDKSLVIVTRHTCH